MNLPRPLRLTRNIAPIRVSRPQSVNSDPLERDAPRRWQPILTEDHRNVRTERQAMQSLQAIRDLPIEFGLQ